MKPALAFNQIIITGSTHAPDDAHPHKAEAIFVSVLERMITCNEALISSPKRICSDQYLLDSKRAVTSIFQQV